MHTRRADTLDGQMCANHTCCRLLQQSTGIAVTAAASSQGLHCQCQGLLILATQWGLPAAQTLWGLPAAQTQVEVVPAGHKD